MSWLAIGVWLCALTAAICTAVVGLLMLQNRRMSMVVLAQLNGLSETHRVGLDILTIDLDRLKARVDDLEGWRDKEWLDER